MATFTSIIVKKNALNYVQGQDQHGPVQKNQSSSLNNEPLINGSRKVDGLQHRFSDCSSSSVGANGPQTNSPQTDTQNKSSFPLNSKQFLPIQSSVPTPLPSLVSAQRECHNSSNSPQNPSNLFENFKRKGVLEINPRKIGDRDVECEGLKEECNFLKEANAALEEEKSSLERKNDSLLEEKEKAEETFKRSMQKKDQQLQDELADKTRKLENGQIAALKQKNEGLLQMARSSSEGKEREEQERDESMRQKNTLLNECNKMRETLGDKNKQIAALEEKNAGLGSKYRSLSNAHEFLQVNKGLLDGAVQISRHANKLLVDQNLKLRQELEAAKGGLNNPSEKSSEIKNAKGDERDKLRLQLRSKKAVPEITSGKNKFETDKIKKLRDKNCDLKNDKKALEKKNNKLSNEKDALSKEHSDLKNKLEALAPEVLRTDDLYRDKIRNLKEKNDALNRDNTDLKVRNFEILLKNKDVEDQLSRDRSGIDDLKKTNDQLNAENDRLKKDKARLKRQGENLKGRADIPNENNLNRDKSLFPERRTRSLSVPSSNGFNHNDPSGPPVDRPSHDSSVPPFPSSGPQTYYPPPGHYNHNNHLPLSSDPNYFYSPLPPFKPFTSFGGGPATNTDIPCFSHPPVPPFATSSPTTNTSLVLPDNNNQVKVVLNRLEGASSSSHGNVSKNSRGSHTIYLEGKKIVVRHTVTNDKGERQSVVYNQENWERIANEIVALLEEKRGSDPDFLADFSAGAIVLNKGEGELRTKGNNEGHPKTEKLSSQQSRKIVEILSKVPGTHVAYSGTGSSRAKKSQNNPSNQLQALPNSQQPKHSPQINPPTGQEKPGILKSLKKKFFGNNHSIG